MMNEEQEMTEEMGGEVGEIVKKLKERKTILCRGVCFKVHQQQTSGDTLMTVVFLTRMESFGGFMSIATIKQRPEMNVVMKPLGEKSGDSQ